METTFFFHPSPCPYIHFFCVVLHLSLFVFYSQVAISNEKMFLICLTWIHFGENKTILNLQFILLLFLVLPSYYDSSWFDFQVWCITNPRTNVYQSDENNDYAKSQAYAPCWLPSSASFHHVLACQVLPAWPCRPAGRNHQVGHDEMAASSSHACSLFSHTNAHLNQNEVTCSRLAGSILQWSFAQLHLNSLL